MVLCVRHDDSFDSDLARGEPDPQILTVLRALAVRPVPSLSPLTLPTDSFDVYGLSRSTTN